jgi:hypothetical protein
MTNTGIWYHGSKVIFDTFILPRRYSPNEQLGFGIHFAKNKEFAGLYGNIIYRCKLHPSKVLNIANGMAIKPGSKYDSLAKDFFKGTQIRPYFIDKDHYVFGEGIIDSRPAKKAIEILRKHGYDAVAYEAKYGTRTFNGHTHGANYTHKTPAIVMLDPSKVEVLDYRSIK